MRKMLSAAMGVLMSTCMAMATCPPSTWTVQPQAGSGQRLGGVAYGGGTWVAVGASGEVLTSVDGTTWTDLTPSPTSYDFLDVAYDNGPGTFMAVGSDGVVFALSGPAGGTGFLFGTSMVLGGVAYGNGAWVAVGGEFSLATGWDELIIRSTNDGASWSEVYRAPASSATSVLTDVAFTNGAFVAVAGDGDVHRSTTGGSWSVVASLGTSLKCVSAGPSHYFAGGTNGRIYRSSTGTGWSTSTVGSGSWFDIVAGKGWLAAVGQGGSIAVSGNNGSSWSTQSSGTTDALESVGAGDNGFISVGTSNPGNQRIVSSLCTSLPNLAPYGGLAGWTAPVEVMSSTRGAPFYSDEVLELRAAWANFGAADAGAFAVLIEVETAGDLPVSSPGLASLSAQFIDGVTFGPLEPGLYDITVTIDSDAEVAEEDEGDNVYALEVEILCGSSCPEDADCSGSVDFGDLNAVLLAWGTSDPDADLNDDGMVDFDDLNMVLLAWGQGC